VPTQTIGAEVDLVDLAVDDGQISMTYVATAADPSSRVLGLRWRSCAAARLQRASLEVDA
jgi:hypothetical protein